MHATLSYKYPYTFVTGISGSNPERAQGDIPFAVTDLTRKHSRGVRDIKAFKSLSPDGTSINCQVGRSLTARFLFCATKSETFVTLQDIILSVEIPASEPPKCSLT
jgi:hypothetical protein